MIAAAPRCRPRRSDEIGVVLCALFLRVSVCIWAWSRFPPADDGKFYQVVAERIARGLGYTWLWPDGVVTYAAHYPVGYPALMAAAYAIFGSSPGVAMLENALLGTLGVWACYRLGARSGHRGVALAAGGIAAVHPSLVFYTPALMTEGVTAALFASLALLSLEARTRASWRWPCAVGLLCGLVVLVRPQALVLAPVFGALAAKSEFRARALRALLVTLISVLVCVPWTARNCARLDHCAFVSANGGWNLFIGSAPGATGTWVSIDELGVPAECRNEFGEAGKDRCFGHAGLRNVETHPAHFLALVPAKLRATFDWAGTPGHYLHAANWQAFDYRKERALATAEILVQRLIVLLGIVVVGFAPGAYARVRQLLCAIAFVLLLAGIVEIIFPSFELRYAWLAHLILVAAVALLGRRVWERPNALLAAAAVLTTAATHAVFFGAPRYGLVCALLLVPLAAEVLALRRPALPKDGLGPLATPFATK